MVSQKKQLKRLKKDAQRLWGDQQALLHRANDVAHDAWPHAQKFAEQAAPNAKAFYDDRVKPAAKKSAFAGKAAGNYAASTAKDAVSGTVLPAVSSAIAAAISIAEEAGGKLGLGGTEAAKQGKKTLKDLNKVTRSGHRSEVKARAKLKGAAKAGSVAAKVGKKKIAKATGQQSGVGAGGIVGIVLGALLLAGIGYAVWQTLRADDDLWVADEDPETTPPADTPAA